MGISPTSLHELLKLDACPKPTDKGLALSEMLKFARKQMVTQMAKGGISDAVSARMRLTIAQIAKIELQNENARGKYLDRDVWKQEFGGLIAEMDASFSRSLMQELPLRLEGLSSVKIRDALKEAYDIVRNEFFEKALAIRPKGER